MSEKSPPNKRSKLKWINILNWSILISSILLVVTDIIIMFHYFVIFQFRYLNLAFINKMNNILTIIVLFLVCCLLIVIVGYKFYKFIACFFACNLLRVWTKRMGWRIIPFEFEYIVLPIFAWIIVISLFPQLFSLHLLKHFLDSILQIFLFIFVILVVEISGRVRSQYKDEESSALYKVFFLSYYKPRLLIDTVFAAGLIVFYFFVEYVHPKINCIGLFLKNVAVLIDPRPNGNAYSTLSFIFLWLSLSFLFIVVVDTFIILHLATKSDFETKFEMILTIPINNLDIATVWKSIWKYMRVDSQYTNSLRRKLIMNVFVSKILDQTNIKCKRNVISITNALKSFNKDIDEIDIEPIKLEFIDIIKDHNVERMPEYFMKILKQRIEFTEKKFNVCELLSLPEMDYKIESPYYDVTESDDKFAYVDELLKTLLESFAKIYKKLDSKSRINMKKRFNELYGDKNILESVNKDRLIQELSRLTKLSDLLPYYSEVYIKNYIENKTSSGKKLTLTQSVVGFIFEKILEKSEKKKEKKKEKEKE